jgi:cell division protein FtsL
MKLLLPQAILELLTPHKLFAKLNIASKMLLGYMTLVVLSVAVVVYVLVILQRLNKLNNEIVKVEIPIQQTADRMLDAPVAQDTSSSFRAEQSKLDAAYVLIYYKNPE